MTIMVPHYLIHDIEDKRLRSLISRVWRRIPSPARKIIADRVVAVNTDMLVEASGQVEPLVTDEIDAVIVTDLSCVIKLDPTKLAKASGEYSLAVIAHEFAHVFLGHHWFMTVRLFWSTYGITEITREAMTMVEEWQADLCVWHWGFHKELRVCWRESGQLPPPWYVMG